MSRASSLTALVGSRICHDLVSPLGAIGNGIELMGMSGAAKTPEFSLIEESVHAANARLRFFRVAYGLARDDQHLGRSEIAATLASVARGGRLSYFWEVEGDQPKLDVRIAFLLFQCFETAMPHGGDIRLRQTADGMEARAEAGRLIVDAALWNSLTDPQAMPEVTANHVQFALLPEVLAEAGRGLAVKVGDDYISAVF